MLLLTWYQGVVVVSLIPRCWCNLLDTKVLLLFTWYQGVVVVYLIPMYCCNLLDTKVLLFTWYQDVDVVYLKPRCCKVWYLFDKCLCSLLDNKMLLLFLIQRIVEVVVYWKTMVSSMAPRHCTTLLVIRTSTLKINNIILCRFFGTFVQFTYINFFFS